MSENRDWVLLELEVEEEEIEQGTGRVPSKIVRIDPVIDNIVEG